MLVTGVGVSFNRPWYESRRYCTATTSLSLVVPGGWTLVSFGRTPAESKWLSTSFSVYSTEEKATITYSTTHPAAKEMLQFGTDTRQTMVIEKAQTPFMSVLLSLRNKGLQGQIGSRLVNTCAKTRTQKG